MKEEKEELKWIDKALDDAPWPSVAAYMEAMLAAVEAECDLRPRPTA